MAAENLYGAFIQGGLLILVVLLGSWLTPTISPKIRVWLWRLVFIKLILSLLPFGTVMIHVLPPQPATRSAIFDGAQPRTAPLPSTSKSFDLWTSAWCLGMAWMCLNSLQQIRRCQRIAHNARPVTDPSLLGIVSALAGKTGRRVAPRLMTSDEVPTVMVMGLREATALLPANLPEADDLRLMLAHEVAHVAHRDLEWNALTWLVQILFCFHPLVWLAVGASQQAQESAADLLAIRLANTSPRRYGEMLVRATVSPIGSFAAGLMVGSSTARIQGRLKELRPRKSRLTFTTLLATIIFVAAVIAMTPAYKLARQSAQGAQAHDTLSPIGIEPLPNPPEVTRTRSISSASVETAGVKHEVKRSLSTHRVRQVEHAHRPSDAATRIVRRESVGPQSQLGRDPGEQNARAIRSDSTQTTSSVPNDASRNPSGNDGHDVSDVRRGRGSGSGSGFGYGSGSGNGHGQWPLDGPGGQ